MEDKKRVIKKLEEADKLLFDLYKGVAKGWEIDEKIKNIENKLDEKLNKINSVSKSCHLARNGYHYLYCKKHVSEKSCLLKNRNKEELFF